MFAAHKTSLMGNGCPDGVAVHVLMRIIAVLLHNMQ
jgi:hypothetical protein